VSEFRVERDTMGEIHVPVDALWRAQTQRAVENFPVSGRGLEPAQIRALARIKAAAATVNAELGILDAEVADAIVAAAREVAAGEHAEHFPIDTFQTGSGTSSNMNANEVVATLASRRLSGRAVHPNDHVNASQSSNDVFPSSIHLAATDAVSNDLIPSLAHLMSTLDAKGTEFDGVVKAGRTHLMDATPVTLGQEFHGYGTQMRLAIERLQSALPRLAELPLGGTAVGTGINMPPGFAARVIELLRRDTGLPLSEARNHFEAQGARDALVETSGQLRTAAVGLYKIANDIRWMGSGPRAGLGELHIPDLQPGSSIMPGKVNPVIPEAVIQVAAQVIGNDAAITLGGLGSIFELNTMMPLMAHDLLFSIETLGAAAGLLAERCVEGIEADAARARELLERSLVIVTALVPLIGYDAAAEVSKEAYATGRSLREIVVARGLLTPEEVDTALDLRRMTEPGLGPAGSEGG
jgi:fumarate hydratase, class II